MSRLAYVVRVFVRLAGGCVFRAVDFCRFFWQCNIVVVGAATFCSLAYVACVFVKLLSVCCSTLEAPKSR